MQPKLRPPIKRRKSEHRQHENGAEMIENQDSASNTSRIGIMLEKENP